MRWIPSIVLFAMLGGCTCRNEGQHGGEQQKDTDGPPGSDQSHDLPEGNHDSKSTSMLLVTSEPEMIRAGQPASLRLMIHDAGGAIVKNFETVHEKKIHLIIVSEGLDQFAHIYPLISPDGIMNTVFTFPTGGTYRLYADHKPWGKDRTT